MRKRGLETENLVVLAAPTATPGTINSTGCGCGICGKEFTELNRRHACKRCGLFIDQVCSQQRRNLKLGRAPERVCDNCCYFLDEGTKESDLASPKVLKKFFGVNLGSKAVFLQGARRNSRGDFK